MRHWWSAIIALVLAAVWCINPLPASARASARTTPVLIIDAGHGGEDGGAVASDGTLESDINLDIALRLEALAEFWGIQTVMTRDKAVINYPEDAATLSAKKKADQNARIALISTVSDGILLSIHQNNYPAEAPFGIQVFFGKTPGADELAAVLQNNLTAELCPENRRMAEPIDEGIYLMRKVSCPAVLVECGFLSNPNELQRLKTEQYRTQLAAVMLASFLQYTRGTQI